MESCFDALRPIRPRLHQGPPGGREPACPTPALREARGWQLVREYVDKESGKTAERSEFQALFAAAARREFDVVVVWALDRFSREGVSQTFGHLEKLRSYGVGFEYLTEPHFRTTGPFGELLTAIYAWLAKQERVRLVERINAGIERAQAEGTRSGNAIGRPRRIFDRGKVTQLRESGLSIPQVARQMGLSVGTVARVLKASESKAAFPKPPNPGCDISAPI